MYNTDRTASGGQDFLQPGVGNPEFAHGNHRTRQTRTKHLSSRPRCHLFSSFSHFLSLLARKQRQESLNQPGFSIIFLNDRLSDDTAPTPSRKYALVEEDVALNHFLSSLRALVLVLFRPNPDSLDAFDVDAADLPSTPSLCCSNFLSSA
jgi:hypothetical protein